MIADLRQADRMIRTYHCTACPKARPVARPNPTTKAIEVVCGRCRTADHLTRTKSITDIWRENPDAVPVEIRNTLERKYGVEAMTDQSLALSTPQSMVQRIESARWLKAVSPEDRIALADLSVRYGLDPLMKELIIYEGSPYITVNGLIRLAHRQKKFAGLEDRPMSEQERKQYGYAAPVCWIAKAYRSDWQVPATGTGKADPQHTYRNNMIEQHHPEWMARSRAIRQALKLAFPHFLPFEELESAEERGIDPETGEIIENERPQMRVVEPEATEGEFTNASDLAPSETPGIPEAQDEEAAKQDLRDKITAAARAHSMTKKQIEEMSLKYGGTIYAELTLDGLIALADALVTQKAS